MNLTEVKATKFSYDDTEYMDGIIKRANSKRDKKQGKLTLANIMRESTLEEIKRIERQLNKMDKDK